MLSVEMTRPFCGVWAATRGEFGLDRRSQVPFDRTREPRLRSMPGSFETPILVRNGIFDTKQIAGQFLEHSKAIEQEIVDPVFRSILEYDQTKDDQERRPNTPEHEESKGLNGRGPPAAEFRSDLARERVEIAPTGPARTRKRSTSVWRCVKPYR